MKSILNVKKETSNLIKGICSHKICFGIKSQPVKKTICHSVPKTFDLAAFQMKAAKTPKNLKQMPYISITKKAFQKKRK